jgi:peroxin-19
MSQDSKHAEDEFDELDDLLDEFADQVLSKPPGSGQKDESVASNELSAKSEGQVESSAPNVATVERTTVVASESTTKNDARKEPAALPELDDDFAKSLQEGVGSILQELKDEPGALENFEALMASLSEATGAQPPSTKGTTTAKSGGAATGGDFHDTISKTMDRLKESRAQMNDKSQDETDFLADMLKQLGDAAGQDGDSDGLKGLLAGLLDELSSKEILYEPIKDMADRYGPWLEKNGSKISADEKARYEKQYAIARAIRDKFEEPGYSDSDKAARRFITEKMEEMQQSGSPPDELIGDLTSGMIPGFGGASPEGDIPQDLADCNIQ